MRKKNLINIFFTYNKDKTSRRSRLPQILEISRIATITEIVHFVDADSKPPAQQSQALEQPCFNLQLVLYEPLDSSTAVSKAKHWQRSSNPMTSSTTSNQFEYNMNVQNQLLSRKFEDVCITLNQCLICELDLSLVDRLYYLINDVSKMSNESENKRKSSNAQFQRQHHQQKSATVDNLQNFEIKCNSIVKLALRFPIADLRRTSMINSVKKSGQHADDSETKSAAAPTESDLKNEIKPGTKYLIARPVTMAAFRRLRDQILTLHIFDFHFQTLLNKVQSSVVNATSDRQLTIVCSQINAYYQYARKERPIHFGLIQQKDNEPRSLIFSIKLPVCIYTEAIILKQIYFEHLK